MGNPLTGVFYHWLGGLASASFYIPYRGVKKWSWETYPGKITERQPI
jgi:L-rhamnose-H+ transport protein